MAPLHFNLSNTMLPVAVTISVLSSTALARPTRQCLSDPTCGPIPGLSSIYSDATSIDPPWPGNTTGAVLNITSGPPGPDDQLFQNLLSAEWIIFSFHQQGVEEFNSSDFVTAGFANDTYDRIREIRNNEAGHLRIFQNQISSNSIKPGPCRYQYPFDSPKSFMALQLAIEVGSMAFLTGLELRAQSAMAKGALLAIAETETHHNTWSELTVWHSSPFAGPSDTVFPYADQILRVTSEWVVEGSCPAENTVYPAPTPNTISLGVDFNRTHSVLPGSSLSLTMSRDGRPVTLDAGCEYYAIFFHGLVNIAMPFHVANMSTTIPASLEPRGIYEVVIARERGAVTEESVVAGPALLCSSRRISVWSSLELHKGQNECTVEGIVQYVISDVVNTKHESASRLRLRICRSPLCSYCTTRYPI